MTCEEVIARLPDELRAKIGTNARATVDSHHARLIDHKRQELQDLELEHQQAVEDLERTLRGEIGKDYSLQVPEWQESASPTRESMVLAVLSDFSDQDFIRRDVEARIVEVWPEVEPQTEPEANDFTSGIAALMRDLVEKGQLQVRKGESRFEPRVYGVKDI
jgi:hypothetical protein